MIFVVELEDEKYFTGITECGRYALSSPYISDAVLFEDEKSASAIVETWGGKVNSYNIK